jgi:hypothetical protein
VTTIFAYFVGRSLVSAITQTPASGPFGPVTVPEISFAAAGSDVKNARTAAETDPVRNIPTSVRDTGGVTGVER